MFSFCTFNTITRTITYTRGILTTYIFITIIFICKTSFYGDEYINHPDHRAAAQAALEAVFPAASMRLVFPELAEEGLAPHQVKQVYIWGSPESNVWIDIAETLVQKIEALRQHKSQMGDWDPAEMITRWAKERAEGQEMEYAESFRRMILVRDSDDAPEEPEPGQDEVHDRP